ncbi:hypothetical protein F5X98DRAFT_391889 [Xylaria grammica]|nr:hypothetical protein F5X98DRAFT_391889 [Xylaria grammica]
MALDKEVKQGYCNDFFDESLLDPRLRSETAKTYESETDTKAPALDPTSTSTSTLPSDPNPPPSPLRAGHWDDIRIEDMIDDDENTVLPESVFKSLDYIIAPGDMQADERLWLIGLQLGIGLGVCTAREAVLNEMQGFNTVFGRQIQRDPSDPEPYRMRMILGEHCRTGFDLRVANRAANRYIRNCNQIADMVVYNGITACLPETGNHVLGTSMLFSEEDVVRCHANSQVINEWLGIIEDQLQPNSETDINPDPEQPAPPIASYMGDGASIGGVSMTQLSGTAALIANAVTSGIGIVGLGTRQGQNMPGPTPDVAPPTQDAHRPGHLGKDYGGFKAEHDNADRGKDAPNEKPEVELRA